MAEKRILLTQDGYDKLVQKLDYLKSVRRIEVANRLKAAIALGDLSENSEYEDAKNEQAFLEGEIFDLEGQISNSEIIQDKAGGDVIDIGNTVTIMEIEEESASPTYGTVSKIYRFVNGELEAIEDTNGTVKEYKIHEEDFQELNGDKIYRISAIELKQLGDAAGAPNGNKCYRRVEGGLIVTPPQIGAVYVTETESSEEIYGKIDKIYKIYRPLEDSEEESYRIVGTTESNPDDSKISDESPLGAALMGKKAEDIAEVHAPVGIILYEIIRIEE